MSALTSDPWKWFTSLLLPWLVLAAGSAAIYARLMRWSLTETMQEDYIRTARAKGLSERRVVLHHGVRAAINPILTILALDIATLLGGAILVEVVFDIHGIGQLAYTAIRHSDLLDRAGHRVTGGAVHRRGEHRRGYRVCVFGSSCPVLVIHRFSAQYS